MLFEQAVYEYVEDKQFGRKPVRPNTMEGYMSAIKCHLMPMWQGREVESITCDELQACALVQLSCGLRPCEAIALTWADVNLSTGEVSVTKGLHEAFGEVYQSPTKTEKSTRTVVLPRYAVERLREIRRERSPRRSERLVDMRPSAYRRRVRAWFAKRGVRMCAQHLRHTFGTLSLQAGTPLETVSLMLGHESTSTAYEHYLVGNSALMREAQRGYAALLMGAA